VEKNYTKTYNLAIFASGGGSNARALIEYFKNNAIIKTSLIVVNNPHAGVINIGMESNIPVQIVSKYDIYQSNNLLEILKEKRIDYLILAGFLWLIPKSLLETYPNRILNIHPSLLPKYGGKGMYGIHVHEQVKKNFEKETGVTIHLVNEKYDDGDILFQQSCLLSDKLSVEEIAAKVLVLEHQNYGKVIEHFIHTTTNQ
jgi:phosphoribosylglycinamide formyltransferase-1